MDAGEFGDINSVVSARPTDIPATCPMIIRQGPSGAIVVDERPQTAQRSVPNPLVRPCRGLHENDRRVPGKPGLQQPGGQVADGMHAHIDDRGRLGVGQRRPVEILGQAAVARMGGDVLHPARHGPVGERNAKARRRAAGGGDAGHDFAGDASRTDFRHFLGEPAENGGVAALQAHHALAAQRHLDDQLRNVFLVAGFAVAALADRDALRFAPREVQDRIRHKVVVEHHVGGLEQPHRLHRHQLRIARPRTDEGHRACRRGLGEVARQRQHVLPVRIGRCAVGRDQGRGGETLPERAARAERQREIADQRTPGLRRLRPALEAGRDRRLYPHADGLPEHRSRAIGRNADDQRRAVHHRAELHVAEGRAVHHVDRHAGEARRAGKRLRFAVSGDIGDGQRRAADHLRRPGFGHEMDPAGFVRRPVVHQPVQRLAAARCVEFDIRARRRQQLRLPGDAVGGSSQDHAPSGELVEQRQGGKRFDPRGIVATGPAACRRPFRILSLRAPHDGPSASS